MLWHELIDVLPQVRVLEDLRCGDALDHPQVLMQLLLQLHSPGLIRMSLRSNFHDGEMDGPGTRNFSGSGLWTTQCDDGVTTNVCG